MEENSIAGGILDRWETRVSGRSIPPLTTDEIGYVNTTLADLEREGHMQAATLVRKLLCLALR